MERRANSVSMERSASAMAVKPVRLDRKSMTVLDRQLSVALQRQRSQRGDFQEEQRPESLPGDQQSVATSDDDEAVKHHWRRRLLHFLHDWRVHTAMTALLILDLITVVASLELQIQSSRLTGEAKEVCLHAYEVGEAMPEYLVDDTTCNPDGLPPCDYKAQPEYHDAHVLHSVELGLAYLSIIILSIFLLENLGMLVALGLNFFRHFFFVMDIVVVAVSLALEAVAVASAHLELAVGGILIVARMWRFFRVAHGIYFLEHSDEAAHSAEADRKGRGGGSGSSSGASPASAGQPDLNCKNNKVAEEVQEASACEGVARV